MARKFNVELLLNAKNKTGKDLSDTKKSLLEVNAAMIVLAATTAAFTAAIVKSTKNAVDFEKQMANVNTMLSNQDTKFLKPLSKDLRALAVEYGEATDTLTLGLYNILSASVPVSQSIDVLTTSVQAATAGMTDTGIAADAITTILNSFQIEAKNSADVSDLLFAIVKRGKTTFGELAGSIGMVTSSAATAGLSIEEMGAALATMTRAGLNTTVATTSLNALIMEFVSPTEQGAKAAKKFGFELNTTTLKTLGLAGVIEKLKDATSEEIAAIFTNRRSLRGLNSIIQQSTGFTKDLELMVNRAGSTQEAFAKASDTAAFQNARFKTGIKDLSIDIGNVFLPALKNVVKTINDSVLPSIKKAIAFFNNLGTIIKSIPSKVKFLGSTFTALKEATSKTIKGILMPFKAMSDTIADVADTITSTTETVIAQNQEMVAAIVETDALGKEEMLSNHIFFLEEKARLDEEADAIAKESLISFKEAWILNWQEIENKQLTTYQALKKITGIFQNALSAGFVVLFKNIGSGWQALTMAMQKFGDILLNSFIQMLADMAAKWVIKHTVMALATRLFATQAVAANSAVAGAEAVKAHAGIPFVGVAMGIAFAAAAIAAISGFAKFASGVRGFGGGTAIVGENGPELINLPTGANVFNNQETRNIMGAGGGGSKAAVVLNVNFSNNTFLGSVEEISEAVGETIFEKLELNALL